MSGVVVSAKNPRNSENWSERWDSNPRPLHPQRSAGSQAIDISSPISLDVAASFRIGSHQLSANYPQHRGPARTATTRVFLRDSARFGAIGPVDAEGGSCEPPKPVAALFVETGGSYYGLPGVDPWDEARDARAYAGPYPVVAHPPCQRWGKLWAGSPIHIARTGQRKVKGDDGGCFAAALANTRKFGGVIEHPWQSHAWKHFGLAVPPREGGWIKADDFGGWTCCVEQGRYGHYARKPTLLLAYHCELPELDWGIGASRLDPAVIERLGLKRAKRLGEVCSRGGGVDSTPRIGTPTEFRDLLIAIARTARLTGGSGTCAAPKPEVM